ncbi:hypothetical protein OPT61_g8333 [Boeremia exigua]|uniref:Uncharacterized protein n=1 Tax=Boeremia exigua TaxID=749465 RepID=A0ACC2HYP3_9PLEO|nr:hypothetical protein OPT61_g8333 [Boeremia exigua]
MARQIRSALFATSVLWQLTAAKPADPTITTAAVLPRQNSDNFIGYLEVNNTWSSLQCDAGLTWYQSGQYAQCCPETLTHCYAPTACVGGSQIYTYPDITSVRTIACTENYNNAALSICNTIFIYENSLDSNPRTNINCGDTRANWSYYRDIPASATEKIDTSPTTAADGAPTTAPTGSVQPVTKQTSKVWIAGAVAGPVIGILLGGAAVWCCMRRKKKKNAQMSQHGAASMAPGNPSQPPPGVGGYTDAKPQFQPAQPTYYNPPGQPDPYAQQGYPQQGGFPSPQMSPAPQYGFQPAYNTTANSPPGVYPQDTKYEANGGAAELAGGSAPAASSVPGSPGIPGSPQPQVAPVSHVAELSGSDATPGQAAKPQ